jgi:hypothetical protein
LYDADDNGTFDCMGETVTTLAALLGLGEDKMNASAVTNVKPGFKSTVVNLEKRDAQAALNAKKATKGGYINSGFIHVDAVSLTDKVTVAMEEEMKEAAAARYENAGALVFQSAQLFAAADALAAEHEDYLAADNIRYENFGYEGPLQAAGLIDFLFYGPGGPLQRLDANGVQTPMPGFPAVDVTNVDKHGAMRKIDPSAKAAKIKAARKQEALAKSQKDERNGANEFGGGVGGTGGATLNALRRRSSLPSDGFQFDIPDAELTDEEEEEMDDRWMDTLKLDFRASDLPKMDVLSSADPFLEIHSYSWKTRRWLLVVKSEIVMNNRNPVFPTINVQSLKLRCDNPRKQDPLMLRIWDHDRDSAPDFIGEIKTTLDELREGGPKHGWQMFDKIKQRDVKGYVDSGRLKLLKVKAVPESHENKQLRLKMARSKARSKQLKEARTTVDNLRTANAHSSAGGGGGNSPRSRARKMQAMTKKK